MFFKIGGIELINSHRHLAFRSLEIYVMDSPVHGQTGTTDTPRGTLVPSDVPFGGSRRPSYPLPVPSEGVVCSCDHAGPSGRINQ